jgi:branched-chain amino acid transport system permease protein
VRALETELSAVPSLFVIQGRDQGTRFELEDAVVGLGRDASNPILVHDTEVSRRHAEAAGHRLVILVGDQPKSIPVFTDLPPIRLAGVSIGYQTLWIVGTSLVLIALLALFFQKTLVGRAMRACSINREAAALQGIQVSRMLALSFALSAALGAIAGILLTPTQFTAFNVGTPFAISGFIAAIVGGFGRPFGAFLGGIALGLAQALAVFGLGSGLKNVAALAVLLAFLFFRPSGILGSAR